MNHKFKRQLIIISVSKLETQHLNQELKKPNPRTTVANYNNAQIENPVVTVPGNRSYSSTTKFGKKICVVGDSHIRRIKRNLFNNSLCEGKAHLNGFNGANIKRLDHFITPTLVEDRPDIVIIHIGSNDITHNIVGQVDVKDNVNRIINIGKKCLSYGVKEVIISSIFIKKHFKLTRIITTHYVMSAKEITSNASVTTTLLEKFYGEMVCT